MSARFTRKPFVFAGLLIVLTLFLARRQLAQRGGTTAHAARLSPTQPITPTTASRAALDTRPCTPTHHPSIRTRRKHHVTRTHP